MATGAEAAAASAAASSCLRCCCNKFEQYIVQAEKNVSDLEFEAKKLAAIRVDVGKLVTLKQLGSSFNEAENWMERSEAATEKAEKIRGDSRAMCLHSLNLWSRYNISKRALRVLIKARELIEEGRKLEAGSKAVLLQQDGLHEKQIETRLFGMDPYLTTALKHIDGDMVGIIGICGMGGVGKTTLLRKIHSEFLPGKGRSNKFEKIMWAVVSKKSIDGSEFMQNDLVMLQNDLARELGGLSLDPVPDPLTKESLEHRASPIYRYLSTKSFLLLLDDLWSPLELRSIGVPDPNSGGATSSTSPHKHKVVLTSRSETVCGNMQAANGLINVKCLDDGNAWLLFQFNATEQTIASHPEIQDDLSRKVMKECQGLPLALNTIGKALSTKVGDPAPWKGTLAKLQGARHVEIPGMEKESASMLHRLKISYDLLPSERDRDCFLSCCLWPEDYSIEKAKLVECWFGLGIIPESSGVDTCLEIISNLEQVNLLEPGDDDTAEVKLHDTIRDMSLWISSDCGKTRNKWLVRAGIGTNTAQMVLSQWREGSSAAMERVSLMNNCIEELPAERMPECSVLKVLMLQHNTPLLVVPGGFIQSAPALTYLDLSSTGIEDLPGEIRFLRALAYLNLSESHIKKLPDELSSLMELKYFHASATISLATMPCGIISKLSKLQTLDVFQSRYTSWDERRGGTHRLSNGAVYKTDGGENSDDGSCLDEFKSRATSLKRLGITIDKAEALKKLARCELVSVKRLCLKRMPTPPSLHVLPSNLVELLGTLDMLKSLEEFMLSTFSVLKEVIIDGGGDDDGTERQREYCLPALKILKLVSLYTLEQIRFQGIISANDFLPNLHTVQIYHCFKIKNVNWLLRLPQLAYLDLQFCNGMKTLIDEAGMEQPIIDEIVESTEQPVDLIFPLLKTLTIHSLTSLTCLYSGASVNFPALEILEITQCSTLTRLNIRPQRNLREIRGGEKWWHDLQWEDNSTQEMLHQYFRASRLKRSAGQR